MIQLNFRKEKECQVKLADRNNEMVFKLNSGELFPNRKLFISNGGFVFDGYSTWFSKHKAIKGRAKDFSITFLLAPMSYESGISGLISNIAIKEKRGYYIGLRKFGVVEAGFFSQGNLIHFESINRHAEMQRINIITVVFHETAGWCDLYVNGELSNRKQFKRNTCITDSNTDIYIGKYVDHEYALETTKTGTFHGIMMWMEMKGRALTPEEVILRHREVPHGEGIAQNDLDRNIFKGDMQRPIYHMIAPGKWMNEPHAPCYYNGWYHIFYQCNPHAPLWDNIQWGHMVSKDMLHWKDMPMALQVEKCGLDPDGCWSGSSIISKEGIPYLYYTAGNNRCFPNQGIARAKAKNPEDAELKEWEKEPSFLIKQKMGEGWLGEFRDPFVWLEGDTYYMLAGIGDAHNGGGNALLYTSGDGEQWECHGFFLDYDYKKNREVGHVFELPVLLPIRDAGGVLACHIFIFCSCQVEGDVVENYYFLGKWDKDKKTFETYHEKAMLFDLGCGTFTGPSGMVTPDKRSVVFTIAQGKRDPDGEFHSGWAHNGGMPIELSLQEDKLHINPIHEIYSLKGKQLLLEKNESFASLNHRLLEICGNHLYMKLETEERYVEILLEEEEGGSRLTIFYDADHMLFGIKDSVTDKLISKYRNEADSVDIGNESIRIELFIDGSLIEVYLNSLKSITARLYTNGRKRKLKLFGEGKARSIEISCMNSVY